jgi:rfaE bifunctional protein nucleotidyltransferase chain/domain/rfaE bifunctional protein kinase chain/domain
MSDRLLVVGDALLDRDVDGICDRVAPDAPVPVVHDPVVHHRPGGAGLAALLAARAGADVTLVTALGDDEAGQEVQARLATEGIEVVDLRRHQTSVKTRVRAGGHPLVRVDHGDAERGVFDGKAIAEVTLDEVEAVLVADYGLGVADDRHVRARLGAWAEQRALVWDPHPRGRGPVAGARLVTPNRAEVRTAGLAVDTLGAVTGAASTLAERWRAHGVAVTLAEDGAVLGVPGRLPLVAPPPVVSRGDACGAGDCFSSHAAVALARGAVLSEAFTAAVDAASAFVAAGGVSALLEHDDLARRDVESLATGQRVEAVRRNGGTIVATSGCFDLLHAGHVAAVDAARKLGDVLVVLVNSDRSVQDLKGAERPIVGEHDRAALLRSLRCVDVVEIFDERTPVRALERLRPHLFVKGDDYGADELPEIAALDQWGGSVVVVPYVTGRSTTALIEQMDGGGAS